MNNPKDHDRINPDALPELLQAVAAIVRKVSRDYDYRDLVPFLERLGDAWNAARAPSNGQRAVKAVWVCSRCGCEDIEALAWTKLNTEELVSWDETPDYWCPVCDEHRRGMCEVDASGLCLMHGQPFEACKAQNAGLPAEGGRDG
jgi:hypothetical protein